MKDFICSIGWFFKYNHSKRAFVICEIITFKVSNVFGNPTKVKWKWRKIAFGEREGSRFDERERGEKKILQIKISKDIDYTKECIHQLENTLKYANDDLVKALKESFKKEEVVKSHAIIEMSLDSK